MRAHMQYLNNVEKYRVSHEHLKHCDASNRTKPLPSWQTTTARSFGCVPWVFPLVFQHLHFSGYNIGQNDSFWLSQFLCLWRVWSFFLDFPPTVTLQSYSFVYVSKHFHQTEYWEVRLRSQGICTSKILIQITIKTARLLSRQAPPDFVQTNTHFPSPCQGDLSIFWIVTKHRYKTNVLIWKTCIFSY